MKRLDYRTEQFEKVSVCGRECEFIDMRINRSSIPKGKYQYEVAGDDDSGDEPVRVKAAILVNFFGTLICNDPLPVGDDDVLWLEDGDFIWI